MGSMATNSLLALLHRFSMLTSNLIFLFRRIRYRLRRGLRSPSTRFSTTYVSLATGFWYPHHFGVSQKMDTMNRNELNMIILDGFDWLLSVKAGVHPIAVSTETFDTVLSMDLVPMLEKSFVTSSRPIKGLLFTNPHNPFGRCYPSDVILEVMKFCTRKDIHFISDELYAMSRFEHSDLPNPVPFVSALELDVVAAGCDLSRVHTIWSISKDLGSSGLRMVCLR